MGPAARAADPRAGARGGVRALAGPPPAGGGAAGGPALRGRGGAGDPAPRRGRRGADALGPAGRDATADGAEHGAVGAGGGGTRLDLGASYGFNVNPRHLITLSGGLTLGASTPLLPYYEAYGTDAFWRSGYRAGEPGAGLRLSWRYTFDRSTAYFATTLGYDRAYGDLEGLQGLDRSTTTFGTTFGYRW